MYITINIINYNYKIKVNPKNMHKISYKSYKLYEDYKIKMYSSFGLTNKFYLGFG